MEEEKGVRAAEGASEQNGEIIVSIDLGLPSDIT